MKKLVLVIAILFSALGSFAQKQFVVDANAEMRAISGSFSKIRVSHGIDIYLSQSDNEGIAVSASDDKYKAGIKTEIKDGTLMIFYDGENGWARRDRHLKVYISFKTLSSLIASGASDILVAGVMDVPSLKLDISGASDFKGEVKIAGTLDVDLSGASDITISGSANALKIESSGASDVKGFDLVTNTCDIHVSGASDVSITANKEISASASGASSVKYKGSAILKDAHSSGASDISRRD